MIGFYVFKTPAQIIKRPPQGGHRNYMAMDILHMRSWRIARGRAQFVRHFSRESDLTVSDL